MQNKLREEKMKLTKELLKVLNSDKVLMTKSEWKNLQKRAIESVDKKDSEQNIFLIFGYGIPKNILKDENYNFYLKMVFNKIYDLSTKKGITKPKIICSGGRTDMFKPYKRTEADEMIRSLKKISKKSFVKNVTKDWKFISENKSLSTLENFINCKKIIKAKKEQQINIYVFCEQTRKWRIGIISEKVFGESKYNLQVIPIDFDTSSNRYIDFEFLMEKEVAELKHSLWALENEDNMTKHHKIFQEKINYIRDAGPKVQAETIRKWWEEKINKFKNKI
jgi:hypothetical protein